MMRNDIERKVADLAEKELTQEERDTLNNTDWNILKNGNEYYLRETGCKSKDIDDVVQAVINLVKED